MQTGVELRRPGIIVAIVVLNAIDGPFGILTATLLLLTAISQGEVRVAAGAILAVAVPVVILLLSFLVLVSAVGLWMLRRWARVLALGVSLPFTPLSAFGILASGGRDPGTYLGVLTGLLTLYVLCQPRLKPLFT